MNRRLIVVAVVATFVQGVWSFRDITDSVFGTANSGVLAAFGDFNSDKLTDLFLISSDMHNLEFRVATGAKPSFEKSDVKCPVSGIITSVMPGDFDGDSIMDVLVTAKAEPSSKELQTHIFWGKLHLGIDCENDTTLIKSITHQPLLFDYEGDRVVDVLSVKHGDDAKIRTVWTFGPSRSPTAHALGIGIGKLTIPHSNSFVDLNHDMSADLMLTAEPAMELWHWTGNGTFSGPKRRDYPTNAAVRGQSLFVDIDADGDMEHVMPACVGQSDCRNSTVLVFNGSEWVTWLDGFRDTSSQVWRFFRDSEGTRLAVPTALRTADVDMDGYPDFLAVLEGRPKGHNALVRRATLLLNVRCPTCPFGRKLVPYWNYGALANFDSVRLAAFFDIDEDGQMDVLLTNGTKEDGLRTHALRNQFSDDACFIKVLAVSGLCYANCPLGQIAYGTNQPGPFVRYRIIKADGYPQESCTSQLYQSAHFSLQLPYTVFGLGQSPNFVDVLTVAYSNNASSEHPSVHHQWTQIIPNSQMVIIPHPPDRPTQWINKLFVTPGRQVLLTFIALAGTCVFISLIIAAFHWLEKREDRKVKLQEAHQFHFDAM